LRDDDKYHPFIATLYYTDGNKHVADIEGGENYDGGLGAPGALKAPSKSPSLPSPAVFEYTGPSGPLESVLGYSEISSRSASLTSVTIRNTLVDASAFSSSLEGALNLESITLENISLQGNLSRVFLPKLKEFTYQQNQDDKRDSYKSPATLKETLFFEQIPLESGTTWDVERDLLNLGIVLRIQKGGTNLIEVNRPKGEVYLNVKYCHDVLKNIQGDISSLTLINCNTTEELSSIIPHNLKYLNLRNTIPSTSALQQIIKPQTQLQEFYGYFNFHCDWPGYEVYLNIADLPPTTRKIGINNMDLSSTPGFESSVTDFSIGDFINPQIVTDFDKIFVNVKRVSVFNISASYAYPLLKNILKTKAETTALIMFERINANSSFELNNGDAIGSEVVGEVEDILSTFANVSSMESDMLIEAKSKGLGVRQGRPLLEAEKDLLRYTGLGFDKMDTVEDYVLWDKLKLTNAACAIPCHGGFQSILLLCSLVILY
jgi:hypothetical protein